MDVLVLLVLLLVHDGFLFLPRNNVDGWRVVKVVNAISEAVRYLEAGGDGGVLVVSGFGIADEVVPTGEHLPGEGELAFFPVSSADVSIFSHSKQPTRNRLPLIGIGR